MNINNGADNIQNNVEAEEELGSLQRDVGFVCEAMLAFFSQLDFQSS